MHQYSSKLTKESSFCLLQKVQKAQVNECIKIKRNIFFILIKSYIIFVEVIIIKVELLGYMSTRIIKQQISELEERRSTRQNEQLQVTQSQLQVLNTQENQSFVAVGSVNRQNTPTFFNYYKTTIIACLSVLFSIVIFLNDQSFKEECPYYGHEECLQKFILPHSKTWIIKIGMNSIFGFLQFHFLVEGDTYRIIPFVGILEMVYLYFFSDQTISDTIYIGAINFIHIIIISLFLVVYSISRFFLYSFRVNRKIFCLKAIIFIIAWLFFYVIIMEESCDYWEKGINGKIQKIDGLCNIKTPSICWYKIINGKVGFGWLFNSCSLGNEGKDKFNESFKAAKVQGDFISFPSSKNFTEIQLYDQNIQQSVIKYAKGYKTLEEAKSSPEKPDVVFDSENQIYHTDVQKNQTLIKERAEVWQKSQLSDSPPLAKNVLFLFVDTISRQSMHLKLPKVVKWFQKQAVKESYSSNNNQNLNESKEETYQFYRYNSLRAWTQPNVLAMFYGLFIGKEMPSGKRSPSIVKNFKEKGYITGSSNTLCQVNSVSTREVYNHSYQSSYYDHQNQAFACDPNFQDPNNIYSIVQGQSSMGTRCLYGKTIAEYASEYALSFFQKYRDQPKFFSTHLLEGHQMSGEGVNALNEPISKLIEKLDESGFLNDTIVMLISDHGMHMLLFTFGAQNFYTQRNLPGLMVRIPQKMNKRYRDKIRKNQQYVVTAKNIHHFLKHIAYGAKYQGRQWSLLEDLTENISCEKVDITMPQYCSCK